MGEKQDTIKKLQNLFISQRSAALSTLMGDKPYLSLMAFASTDDLRQIIFATNKSSQKYKNLKSNKNIAMLIDNRENKETDIKDSIAVTSIGEAREINGEEKQKNLDIYIKKHPKLKNFAISEDSAIIIMDVKKYIIVSEFEKIEEFFP